MHRKPPWRLFLKIDGRPVGQPRTRSGRGRDGVVRHYVPKKHAVHAFRDAVAAQARVAWSGPPVVTPVRYRAVYVFDPGDGSEFPLPVWYDAVPDIDNVTKAVYDAVKDIVFVNDSQIVDERVQKIRARTGEKPCALIEFTSTMDADVRLADEAITFLETEHES